MTDSYFQHYVLSGGWPMLILLPLSVVTVATILRAILGLATGRISPAAGTAAPGDGTAAGRVAERLDRIRTAHGTIQASDIRAEIDAETLRLYAQIHPLGAMVLVAPLIALAGSVTQLLSANLSYQAGGSAQAFVASAEQALVPLFWGASIAAIACVGLYALRARLFHLEETRLRPAVEDYATRSRRGADAL